MKIPIYQVDAFTSAVFAGNPAAVCLLDAWLEDHILQAMAAENNLSETAFLVGNPQGFDLRWFTPVTEVALCGHATLASAYVLFECRAWSEKAVTFQTRHSGLLSVAKNGRLLEMDFPARPPMEDIPPGDLADMLGATPAKVLRSPEDLLVIFESEQSVRELNPNLTALAGLDWRGVIVTAPGNGVDFVSRFFAPAVGIPEDPVTGSAHCVLVPYWAKRLGKDDLHALQVSKRGGELYCRERGERISIAGQAALYLEGTISI
jgi:PhzF family phenazine biosynthesis protein